MIKSELVARISEQYPHLYQRDVEAIINRILNEIGDALVAATALNFAALARFQLNSGLLASDATRARATAWPWPKSGPVLQNRQRVARPAEPQNILTPSWPRLFSKYCASCFSCHRGIACFTGRKKPPDG